MRDLLASLDIVAAAPASSLDHFRAGSAPYLQGTYAQAIPHYEQALALEQLNPTLDKPLWHLLIHNLGMAYRMTGDLPQARTIFEYGISQDPDNPLYYYNLARTYAGMNDRDHAMESLHAAFYNRHQTGTKGYRTLGRTTPSGDLCWTPPSESWQNLSCSRRSDRATEFLLPHSYNTIFSYVLLLRTLRPSAVLWRSATKSHRPCQLPHIGRSLALPLKYSVQGLSKRHVVGTVEDSRTTRGRH